MKVLKLHEKLLLRPAGLGDTLLNYRKLKKFLIYRFLNIAKLSRNVTCLFVVNAKGEKKCKHKRVTCKIAMFPVELFIRISSTDKKIFIAAASRFIYQIDNVIAHIDRIYYIPRAYIVLPNRISKEITL